MTTTLELHVRKIQWFCQQGEGFCMHVFSSYIIVQGPVVQRWVNANPGLKFNLLLSPSRRRVAPCEGTNPHRLFTPGETKALAESKVHQISRAWVTVRVSVGGHPHHRLSKDRCVTSVKKLSHGRHLPSKCRSRDYSSFGSTSLPSKMFSTSFLQL